MVYYVVETQTSDGVGAAIVNTYTDEQQARQAWHTIMAAASVSSVKKHGAILLTEDLYKMAGEIAPRPRIEG